MFAVVEISAQQFTVRQSDVLTVPRLEGVEGDKISFSNILAGGEESSPVIGAPYIVGNVNATILSHERDKKVLVFKKKRRKGYRKLNGHRQGYTRIQIDAISL